MSTFKDVKSRKALNKGSGVIQAPAVIMAILIAALGLLVALAALYFSSESLRKVDQKNEEMITVHVAELRRSIDEVKKAMKGFEKLHAETNKDIKDIREEAKVVTELKAAIEAVHHEVVALDRNILPQARLRRPNKAENKPEKTEE